MNWFTIGMTSTKYVLMGRLNMTKGDYQVIHKNIYPTQDQFNKTLILTEVNQLGMTNHLIGFCLFGYGIIMLLIHVAICCKAKRWPCVNIQQLFLFIFNHHLLFIWVARGKDICFIFWISILEWGAIEYVPKITPKIILKKQVEYTSPILVIFKEESAGFASKKT